MELKDFNVMKMIDKDGTEHVTMELKAGTQAGEDETEVKPRKRTPKSNNQ